MTMSGEAQRRRIDLTFQPYRYDERATITPRTVEGTAWLSEKVWASTTFLSDTVFVQLDKPVTLSLDGAMELDAMARTDRLHTEGL